MREQIEKLLPSQSSDILSFYLLYPKKLTHRDEHFLEHCSMFLLASLADAAHFPAHDRSFLSKH